MEMQAFVIAEMSRWLRGHPVKYQYDGTISIQVGEQAVDAKNPGNGKDGLLQNAKLP